MKVVDDGGGEWVNTAGAAGSGARAERTLWGGETTRRDLRIPSVEEIGQAIARDVAKTADAVFRECHCPTYDHKWTKQQFANHVAYEAVTDIKDLLSAAKRQTREAMRELERNRKTTLIAHIEEELFGLSGWDMYRDWVPGWSESEEGKRERAKAEARARGREPIEPIDGVTWTLDSRAWRWECECGFLISCDAIPNDGKVSYCGGCGERIAVAVEPGDPPLSGIPKEGEQARPTLHSGRVTRRWKILEGGMRL